ncbi:MAG: hypothetical protein U0930_08865 [Pirellulales bacterium]
MASNYPELNEVQRWLIDSGRAFLADNAQKQRSGLSQIQQALLLQQIEWRKRSRFRFPDPSLWLWSDKSLSQASDWLSAIFKSAVFPEGRLVLDACCGAGVDSVAFTLRGPVIAMDEDPWMAALSASNATAHGKSIESYSEPFSFASLRNARLIHVDPDRRPGNVKTLEADEFSPPLEAILEMIEKTEGGIIKIAPSTRFSADRSRWIEQNCTRVWLGSFGECRQQLLLCGSARKAALLSQLNPKLEPPDANILRMAVVLGFCNSSGADRFSFQSDFEDARRNFVAESFASNSADVEGVNLTDEVDNYVFDLHSVLHAAELHEAWANQHKLAAITDSRGYFTGGEPISSPLAQCFEVMDVVSCDDRKLRKWLRQNKIGTVEVKCRLHALDANSLQRRYSSNSGEPITLLITRFDERVRAIACRRVTEVCPE